MMKLQNKDCCMCAADSCGACALQTPCRASAGTKATAYPAPRWTTTLLVVLTVLTLFVVIGACTIHSAVNAADVELCRVSVTQQSTGFTRELDGLTAFGRSYVRASAYENAFGTASADVVYYGDTAYLPLTDGHIG